ncbi:MAG: AAA-like domain-containing protein [Cyanophyceae cyanobacterium]
MTVDELIVLLDRTQKKKLSSLQEQVLRQAWEGYTYSSIAETLHYRDAYIKNIASQLWQELSLLLGESITKANFRSKLSLRPLASAERQLAQNLERRTLTQDFIEVPGSPVPLDSAFYIERPPVEELAFTEVSKPGGFIHIKAPRSMGKCSLMTRIVAYADSAGYQTIRINFEEADQEVFENADRFFRWFCTKVGWSLNVQARLDDYWNPEIGRKASCTNYFQHCILEQVNAPLVLSLSELNRVFDYPAIAQDFLPLLRFWHEQSQPLESWQRLRIVVTYLTEADLALAAAQSFFNVGLTLELPPFSLEQIQQLALRHGLSWAEGDAGLQRLMPLAQMVGGHPYFVQLAFYHLRRQQISLEQLLQEAPTQAGIYSSHLRAYLAILQEHTRLADAFAQVVSQAGGVRLEPDIAHKLESLGLIKLNGDLATPSCELYRLFFEKQLKRGTLTESSQERLKQLEQENYELKRYSSIDPLTQLANQRYFQQRLEQEWRRSARRDEPLSVIVCDIDFFKAYNDTHGHQAGDSCLRQIAMAVEGSLHRPSDLVARHGSDEDFAIILPDTDAVGALHVATRIRRQVRNLAIPRELGNHTEESDFPTSILTVSLGVATTVPTAMFSSSALVYAANEALEQSKQQGRDLITLSSTPNFNLVIDKVAQR